MDLVPGGAPGHQHNRSYEEPGMGMDFERALRGVRGGVIFICVVCVLDPRCDVQCYVPRYYEIGRGWAWRWPAARCCYGCEYDGRDLICNYLLYVCILCMVHHGLALCGPAHGVMKCMPQ